MKDAIKPIGFILVIAFTGAFFNYWFCERPNKEKKKEAVQQPAVIEVIEKEFNGRVFKMTYNEHEYLEFHNGVYFNGMIHNPDCPKCNSQKTLNQ